MSATLLMAQMPLNSSSSSTYLSQLAQNDAEVFLLVHLNGNGSQVVFYSFGTETAVELVYVIIVEGERVVADRHLGDTSYSALVC